ncbi:MULTISPECIES: ATP/GTP-binding protein [unclassified Streptomyces]|uniref:ATP/GTP-binding protein n=1 Tax=unclassified Streptomyces TaxID=2593676 RepID=UPI000DBA68F3|nr:MULTISPECIES: ATP/GTP-binding protein [unclassified Streptomyces]MYT68340.1 ATP/GTP-binding protein [Streptomyces sp. SID8367]RAJ76976.1 hypothetical protein K377_06145 [Streptomyces sp. PsTaAH-137]
MAAAAPGHHLTTIALPDLADVAFSFLHAMWWLAVHWYVAVPLVLLGWTVWEAILRKLAAKASAERCALTVTPAGYFDPDEERIWRQGVSVLHAGNAMPWWAPKRSRSVRIRLRSDEHHPLAYQLEGPPGAAKYLQTSPFGQDVSITPADRRGAGDDAREFVMRGELLLHGNPATWMRKVPLDPDPLQPLVDAVSALKAGLGDLVEVSIDLQSVSRWTLRMQQLKIVQRKKAIEQRETFAASRSAALAHSSVRSLVSGAHHQERAPMVVPAGRFDRDKALGRLARDTDMARVQILIRCASNSEERARALRAQVCASFKVFGKEVRWSPRGLRILGWTWGCDQWPLVKGWQQRWDSGQLRPARSNVATLSELAGLLKPPTKHCRLPLLAAQLPTFTADDASQLLLQGAVMEADGTRRLIATNEAETLFEIGLGKAGGGKTERALAQAIMVAHAGGGLLYVDPHRDSWNRATRYLAHPGIIDRIQVIDLNPGTDTQPVGAWNLLDMSTGRSRSDVVSAVVDGLAAGMKWDDTSTPRGLTILTSCVQALCALNDRICHEGAPRAQATVFHIRPLLTDTAFRDSVLAAVRGRISDDAVAWWRTVFPTLSPDAFGIILNPLTRLADNPTYFAFLGQPVSRFDLRTAMDTRRIVWVCTAGNSPVDRLVSSLIAHELLRAGRSRRDTPPEGRAPFRAYLDELITIAGNAPESTAAMFEDLRKFGVRVHGMSQSLSRLPQSVRDALLQNASTLATTTGSRKVVSDMTQEWGERPGADQVMALPRFQHYALFTVGGQRIGPVKVQGIHLDDDLKSLARGAKQVSKLVDAAHGAAGSAPLARQAERAAGQLTRVKEHCAAVSLTKDPRPSGAAAAGSTSPGSSTGNWNEVT